MYQDGTCITCTTCVTRDVTNKCTCNTVTQKLIEKGNFEIYFLYITNLEHVFIHVMCRNYVRYTCLCVMCMNVYLYLAFTTTCKGEGSRPCVSCIVRPWYLCT